MLGYLSRCVWGGRLPELTTPGANLRAALTNLLWKVLQQVLPQTEVGQVGEVSDASG